MCVSMSVNSPLAHYWVRVMHGDLANPRLLPEDSDTSEEGIVWMWDEERSVSLKELYPFRQTLEQLVESDRQQQRKDSKAEGQTVRVADQLSPAPDEDVQMTDEETPRTEGVRAKSPDIPLASLELNSPSESREATHDATTPSTPGLSSNDEERFAKVKVAIAPSKPKIKDPLKNPLTPRMDWSYDSNVRQPLNVIYDLHAKHSPKSGTHPPTRRETVRWMDAGDSPCQS